jgi:hypothetical protein
MQERATVQTGVLEGRWSRVPFLVAVAAECAWLAVLAWLAFR